MALIPLNRRNPWLQKRYHTRLPRRAFVGGYIRSEYLPWYEGEWSPASLFAGGEQGVWYDPSDLSTLFQDHKGTIPAAVGQPVGLMLDKSKGLSLGPELLTNGDFSAGAVNWISQSSALLTPDGGRLRVNTGTIGGAYQVLSTTPGKTYLVGGTVFSTTSTGNLVVRVGAGQTPDAGLMDIPFVSAGVQMVGRFTATTATTYVYLRGGSSAEIVWDDISAREISGNHASQPTVTARPTLMQDAGGRAYLQFDGVDDFLQLPSLVSLGADNAWFMGLVKSNSTQAALMTDGTSSGPLLATMGGGGAEVDRQSGNSTAYFVDGKSVVKTRAGLLSAVPQDANKLVEVRGADFTAWTTARISGHPTAAFLLNGNVLGLLIHKEASETVAGSARKYMADKAGVTL